MQNVSDLVEKGKILFDTEATEPIFHIFSIGELNTSSSWLQLMGKDDIDIEDLKNRGYGPVIHLPLNPSGPVAWLSHGRGVLMSIIGVFS